MLATLDFGRTGHRSTRILFGAAALARVDQATADRAVDDLLAAGINHIDVAASYGDAELRLGPALARVRERFFLATKTGERSYALAREEIRRSLERMRVERVDLLQLHNLVKEDEWEQALGDDGALRAAVEARDEGLVRFLGVTGHGTRVAAMHLRSLERFPFDSVLLPCNPAMMADPVYAGDFDRLEGVCVERGVAIQTIKAIARRRWPEGATPTASTWYEPLTDPAAIRAAVHYVLRRPGLFLNTPSDLRFLPAILRAAEEPAGATAPAAFAPAALGAEPLFVRGFGRA